VHIALSAFRFSERLLPRPQSLAVTADQIFTGIRHEWWPTPPDLPARVLAANQRLTSLEGTIIERKVHSLLAEVFPELLSTASATAGMPPLEEQVHIAGTLVEVTQALEDLWLSCDLETQWNHPLNIGWINGFARWTNAPTFRAWWPIISPMFSPAFQRFMREHFPALDQHAASRVDAFPGADLPVGLATTWWQQSRREPATRQKRSVYEYKQSLLVRDRQRTVQMGFVLLSVAEKRAAWTSEDFFVPPSLWGAGIGGAFLRKLLRRLADEGIDTCDVFVVNRRYEISRNQRTERVGFLEFYRGHGFQVFDKGPGSQAPTELCEMLKLSGGDPNLDAWVQLRWTAERPAVVATLPAPGPAAPVTPVPPAAFEAANQPPPETPTT
jgi:GNAT superfamily N-acetyltransferase